MATRNIVPRDDGEGNIGTTLKNWLKGWFKNVFVSGNLTDGVNDVTVAELRNQIDNPSVPDADQIATTDSGETVQDKIDDADAHIADTNNPHSVVKADVGLTNVPDLDTTNAVSNEHTQGTDVGLDNGGSNPITAATIKGHVEDTANPHSVTKAQVGLTDVDDVQQMPLSYLDTDDALTADSDVKVASQSAVKSYIDALLGANDAMIYKGVIDCGANPNYPAGDAGHTYRISVAGKLGGASGEVVEVGDMAICIADSTSSGNQATVGEFWNIIQVNIDGNIVGTSPYSSVDDNLAMFNGTSGKVIEDSGLALADVTGHIANTENPHAVEADQIATTDSGETVQDKIDDADAHIADTVNPHSVDKADVGLTNVPDLDTTDAVNNEHTHTNKTELDKVTVGDHDVLTNNPHSVVADQIATDDSGVDVQEALDAVESDVTDLKASALTFIIDGGGSEITTGIKGDLQVPFGCTITKATLLADQSGSIVVDVWKDTYANFPPIDADSITASAPPTITTATKSEDGTLTGWTKAITAGDILRFNVDSVTDIERVTLILNVTRT